MVNPSPILTKHKYTGNEQVEVTGIHRITRHPVFAGFAMWGLGCMLQRGRLIDMVFWGGFPAFFLLGSLHQDYRYGDNFPRQYWNETSMIPFHAVMTGEQSAVKAYEEMSTMSVRSVLFLGILAVALRGRLRREFWYSSRAYKAW